MDNMQNDDVGVLERLEIHHRELKRLQKQLQKERPTQEAIDRYEKEYDHFLDDVLIFIQNMHYTSDRQVECLMKRCISGYTWKQISEHMNMNLRNAMKLGAKAKEEYYKQMGKEISND